VRGRLSVVGCGIRPGGHLTAEARALIQAADAVHAVVDGLTLELLRRLNPVTRSMQDCYAPDRQRDDGYAEMVQRLTSPLADGGHVCGVFYGHPGVFVWPAHEAMRQARAAGHAAHMSPGVSAEDCLFADLGVDPAESGCQSYEAGDFLLYTRAIDSSAALILWQPGALGDIRRDGAPADPHWLRVLCEVLGEHYPHDHEVVIYEAAVFPLDDPRIDHVPLRSIPEQHYNQRTTLYLRPVAPPRLDPDRLRRLGIQAEDLAPAAFRNRRERR